MDGQEEWADWAGTRKLSGQDLNTLEEENEHKYSFGVSGICLRLFLT